jgi:hypothetical protein
VADGLENAVCPRFLCESLVIEGIYSIAKYGLPTNPLGLSYSANVHAGAHPRLSVYMGVPYPIGVCKRSRPVRKRVSRRSVRCFHIIPPSVPGSYFSFSSIHGLTKRRLQSGLVLAFSISAFVGAIVTRLSLDTS